MNGCRVVGYRYSAGQRMPLETEKSFQAMVIQAARHLQWGVYHTHDSRRSPEGFPDLCLVRPPRIIFAELKSARGRVSAAQAWWMDLLAQCPGVETYLWRPKDWTDIEKCLREQRP